MKLLPPALVRIERLIPKVQVPKVQVREAEEPERADPDISTGAAITLSLLAVAAAAIIGESYMSGIILTADALNAFLNTLLICDFAVLGFGLLTMAAIWYLYSDRYGDHRSILSLSMPAVYTALMALPAIFIASDLAFKPLVFSGFEAEIGLALSLVSIFALAACAAGMLEEAKPGRILSRHLGKIRAQFTERDGPAGRAALQRPVLRGDEGLTLALILDKLCLAGDSRPVFDALEEMKSTALEQPKSARTVALAASMVSLMAETAAVASKHDRQEVIYRALDKLTDVAIMSPHQGTSSLAFRSMGGVFSVCSAGMGERSLSRLETKMMEDYTKVYDRTGRREALDLAAAMAEKASSTRMFAAEEYDGVLYISGGVYRRLAEADDSEEYAGRSLTALSEALTARTAEASPLDHACIKGEIGLAYMAMAKVKNPVKAYRSAAQSFEDAGRLLDAKTYPWDSALYRGKAACAYTFLADEYCRGKRYDDAIQAARGALALYPEVVKFFERRSAGDFVEVSSNMGFAHTIVSEVYLKSRMFDLSLKHASSALGAYSAAAKALDPKDRPERYAFMKTSIGQTHANMAEIHFREKRYESAIGSCDSAIAAYNEAIRIYDERKKDRPASAARKSLKKANDLFSTMMRIGVAEKKPLAPVAEI